MIQLGAPETRRWIGLGCQLVLGIIFVYAGVSKLMDSLRFTASLLGYQIIPLMMIKPLSVVMPWVEVCVGMLMVFGAYPRFTSGTIAGLLGLFTIMIIFALSQGWIIDCGCFGSARPADWGKVVENLVMAAVAVGFYRNPNWVTPYSEWKTWLMNRMGPRS